MKRKLIASTIAITLLCAAAGAGTMAYFTSQANSQNNSFVTGTLKLGGFANGQDMIEEFARLNIDKIKPGIPEHVGNTTLKNVGTLPFYLYRITADNFSGNGWDMLDDQLTLNITIGGEQIFSGNLGGLRAENGGYFDPVYSVAPGDMLDMEISVLMKAAAGNTYQGKNITCDLTVYATQENTPLNGEPNNVKVRFGPAQDANGNTGSPTFVVDGYNTASQVCFDWNWNPNDFWSEKYILDIKHETADPTTNIVEYRVLIFPGERVVSTDGISASDVSVDWDRDIVKINKSAFPADWEGFEVKMSGLQNNSLGTPKTIPYKYWSLNR